MRLFQLFHFTIVIQRFLDDILLLLYLLQKKSQLVVSGFLSRPEFGFVIILVFVFLQIFSWCFTALINSHSNRPFQTMPHRHKHDHRLWGQRASSGMFQFFPDLFPRHPNSGHLSRKFASLKFSPAVGLFGIRPIQLGCKSLFYYKTIILLKLVSAKAQPDRLLAEYTGRHVATFRWSKSQFLA